MTCLFALCRDGVERCSTPTEESPRTEQTREHNKPKTHPHKTRVGPPQTQEKPKSTVPSGLRVNTSDCATRGCDGLRRRGSGRRLAKPERQPRRRERGAGRWRLWIVVVRQTLMFSFFKIQKSKTKNGVLRG